ncbi:hypothetical protein WR25_23065 [Diploscapter pachys]|uniref:Uncharacterized protein n=1 Tax=Diploscapter pachys TaxID=2018661 RepID=A0A2A2JD28_9BILA|nr:hypothetical protein WR25_23065 [Diploscapter pachys]
MDWHYLFFNFMLILAFGECSMSDKSKYQTSPKSSFYELNKQKLGQLWQMAVARGMIKATARHFFTGVSQMEQKVFEQCEKDAKSVVQLAKCAVQIFDQRDFNFEEGKKRGKDEEEGKKSYGIRINIRKIPLKRKRIEIIRRGGNPIRAQIRRRWPRGADFMEEAYEMFLEEERKKKKMELERERRKQLHGALTEIADEGEVTEGQSWENNLFGIPRRLGMERQKRDVKETILKYLQGVRGESADLINVNRLRRIRDYFERTRKCNGYFKLMNEENQRLFSELGLPIESRTPPLEDKFAELDQIIALINSFTNSSASFKLLSPRILSLFPDSTSLSTGRFLSPTLLSFQNEGFFSLPSILQIATSNHRYRQLLLEAVMDISGAGPVMEKLMEKIDPKIQQMEDQQYPWVQKMSRMDRDWLKARETFDDEQESLFQNGQLVFLNETQLEHIYGQIDEGMKNITKLSKEERIKRIENDIRELAKTGDAKWPTWEGMWREKRQAEPEPGHETGVEGHEEHEGHGVPEHEEINGVKFVTLKVKRMTFLTKIALKFSHMRLQI